MLTFWTGPPYKKYFSYERRYEGPLCNIDVNECMRGTAGCAAHAGCTNRAGSFTCTCYWGYSGDGLNNCTPAPQLAALTGRYASDGPSRVACTEGEGVPYPAGAPGFAYDPIGDASAAGSPHDGGMGSLWPVTPQDCQVACEMAQPACTSFSYNAVLAACFLKRGGGRMTCVSPTTPCTEQAQDLVVQHFSCGSWETYFRLSSPGYGMAMG